MTDGSPRHALAIVVVFAVGCSGSPEPDLDAGRMDGGQVADSARGVDVRPGAPAVDASRRADTSPAGDAAEGIEPDAGAVPVRRRFVAVGYGGHRTTSLDGRSWDHHVIEDPGGGDDAGLLRGVGYGAGTFVAVGNRVMTSTDGIDWTTVIADTGSFLSDVEWQDGVWVAAGGNGLRMRSTDGGATFTDRSPFASAHFRGIAAGNGRFVAVGHTYEGAGFWSTTRDALTWTDGHGGAALSQVAFGAGVFVAVGDGGRVSVSLDGATWDESSLGTGRLGDVSFANGEFLVGSGSVAWSSADGRTWTRYEASIPDAIVFGDGVYVGATWTAIRASAAGEGPWTTVDATPPALTDLAVSAP